MSIQIDLPKTLVKAPEQMKLAYADLFTKCRKRHYKLGAKRMCQENTISKLKEMGWTYDLTSSTWILTSKRPSIQS